MKKKLPILVFATILMLSMSTVSFAAQTAMPSDVADNAWYREAADYVLRCNLMEASGDRFLPQAAMTREQIATTLYNDFTKIRQATAEDAGMSLKEAPDYDQISATNLAGVSFCYYAGIMKGNEQGYINPQGNVTRQELSSMLQRYVDTLSSKNADVKRHFTDASAATETVKKFTDYSSIQQWAIESVQFCVANSLLKGNADGSFNPNGNVTRAEFAQIMYNMAATIAPGV